MSVVAAPSIRLPGMLIQTITAALGPTLQKDVDFTAHTRILLLR